MKSRKKIRQLFRKSFGHKKSVAGDMAGEFSNKFTWCPRYRMCILPVCYRFKLTTATAEGQFGAVELVFRLNSIFQTLLAPAGQTNAKRVNGYTELSAQYTKYMVYAAAIELIFTDPSADGVAVGVAIQDSSSTQVVAGNQIDDIDCKEGYKVKFLNNTGSQVQKFKTYIRLNKLEGLSKTAFGDDFDQYGALITTNPALTPLLRIAAASADDTTAKTVIVECRIKYYTKLYGKQPDGMPTYTS